MCIANGRLGSDKFLGNRTCKGSSVVDYAILSPLLFTSVKEFEILPFEPLMSDAHSGLHISLQCSVSNDNDGNLANEESVVTKATWKPEQSDIFLQNISMVNVENYIEKLSTFCAVGTVTKEDVEVLVSECSSLLFDAAEAADMISHKTVTSRVASKLDSR